MEGADQLTDKKRSLLKQGTKVKFKWHGNDKLTYVGYIEIRDSVLYFCAEHNYNEYGVLTSSGESMQYYNDLEGFFFFTHFEILTHPKTN